MLWQVARVETLADHQHIRPQTQRFLDVLDDRDLAAVANYVLDHLPGLGAIDDSEAAVGAKSNEGCRDLAREKTKASLGENHALLG